MGKTLSLTDLGALKNALRKYTQGKKLEIAQFNQVARLAWIGRIVLSPLDPEDAECRAWLLHLERPEGIAAQLLPVDEALYGRIHVLDAEQGAYLAEILREGFDARAGELQALAERDFYLTKFFREGEPR